jgi:hypothetical protein
MKRRKKIEKKEIRKCYDGDVDSSLLKRERVAGYGAQKKRKIRKRKEEIWSKIWVQRSILK